MTYKHNFISLGHSTELLGILFTRYLYKAIDVKKGNSRLNTGFKQGFDSTDHQKLLVKLQNLSVSKGDLLSRNGTTDLLKNGYFSSIQVKYAEMLMVFCALASTSV